VRDDDNDDVNIADTVTVQYISRSKEIPLNSTKFLLNTVCQMLVGNPEGRRPLGRPRRRWEDNIKMDLQEVGGVVGTGWSWLRIGTGGGHLWVR
jgi:hypothetical protein